jgi:hypothetical protein
MLSFLKKIFCAAEPDVTPVPYKVEAPVAEVEKTVSKPAKKPTVKKATTAKPRKPRTPKA